MRFDKKSLSEASQASFSTRDGKTPVIARFLFMHAGTNSFSERGFLASQFALTHEAEPDCVEYVKPVATTPGQECQVSGEEWIPFNHGFGERLLVLSVSAEEGFDGSGQVAQDPKPFPASPCFDVFCECSEILAQHG